MVRLVRSRDAPGSRVNWSDDHACCQRPRYARVDDGGFTDRASPC
jgi:hypothetical protein